MQNEKVIKADPFGAVTKLGRAREREKYEHCCRSNVSSAATHSRLECA